MGTLGGNAITLEPPQILMAVHGTNHMVADNGGVGQSSASQASSLLVGQGLLFLNSTRLWLGPEIYVIGTNKRCKCVENGPLSALSGVEPLLHAARDELVHGIN